MRVYPLQVLPVLVMVMFSVLLTALTVYKYRELDAGIAEEGLATVRQEMARLQRVIQESLAKGNLPMGERELAWLGLNPEVKLLAAITPDGRILFATRFAWKGRPAQEVIPGIELPPAAGARSTGRVRIEHTPAGDAVSAYYPLSFPPDSEALVSGATGALVMRYDLGLHQAQARGRVLKESGLLWLCGLLAMIAMIAALHVVAIRPVRRLAEVAGLVASGHPGAQVRFVGKGSVFSQLGRSFDDMSLEVERSLAEIDGQRRLIERSAAEERALGDLLRLSLQGLPEEDFLQQALQLLLASVSWLQAADRGAVLRYDDEGEPGAARLIASHNIDAQEWQKHLPGGLRHADADNGPLSFSEQPRPHYRLHIGSPRGPQLVLLLYLAAGHQRQAYEEEFLLRVADVISMGAARMQAEQRIEHQAYHDALTGLPNRRLLFDRLHKTLAMQSRLGISGALLFLDLDNFKTLNDALGHSMGDQLLRQVAQRLTATLRSEDTVARLGGDEFVILLPEVGGDTETAVYRASSVARKIFAAIDAPFQLDEYEHHLSTSIGIAILPDHGRNPDDLLRHADAAMYRAKSDGGNGFRFYRPEMQIAADQRLTMEKQLRRALAEEQFALHYQPLLDSSARVIGAEALIRWQHPEVGTVPPAKFIPVAEACGLIGALGEWVLRTACRQIKAWTVRFAQLPAWYVSVNLSAHQFRHSAIVTVVESILRETGAEPGRLMLELTETVVIENLADTIDKMNRLKALGVRFSLDDFGTGYSSLAYLKQLPIDLLKIDRSFVRDIANSENDAAIVQTIIDMTRHLRMEVLAEGVESKQQVELLLARGCRTFQGYYFSPALPAVEFEAYVEAAPAARLPLSWTGQLAHEAPLPHSRGPRRAG